MENGDARRKKAALQDISRLYRLGSQLNAEGRNAFEKLINGTVLSQQDPKVVRWCLNALARLGTRHESSKYVELSLRQHQDKPEIVAAAVAALYHMYNGNVVAVPGMKSIDPAIQTLAALQIVDPKKLDLCRLKIDVESADLEVLKLALITVGLNRDVENLFHPRHSNGQIVRVLGQHDSPIIRQYSVWAVLENRKLTIDDLGISFSKIHNEPPNVQAKLLQLAAEQLNDNRIRHGIIMDGSFNENREAREGLAKGLLATYYDGLEEITINWFDTEASTEVKGLISEHFARYSDVCHPYADKALAILEAEPKLRSRILVGAEGTPLYGIVKATDIREGTPDLFGYSSDLAGIFGERRSLFLGRKSMKVLFLAASPIGQQPLRLAQEARDLREQLALVRDRKIDLEVEHRWRSAPTKCRWRS